MRESIALDKRRVSYVASIKQRNGSLKQVARFFVILFRGLTRELLRKGKKMFYIGIS